MMILERTVLKIDSSEQETSEKGQFWKGKTGKRTILNRKNLKKDDFEKDKSEN